jgi:hypothetical protein
MDIDDPEQRDIDGKCDLGDAIGFLRPRVLVNGAASLNLNADGYQPTADFGGPAKHHHSADVERRFADVHIDFHHVQHGNIGDHRKPDHQLDAEAELHVQRLSGLGVGGDAEIDLADGIHAGGLQRETHDVQAAVKVDKGATSRHQLLQVGGNGQDFVEVETDFQARLPASAEEWD